MASQDDSEAVTEWLNHAAITQSNAEKVECLRKVQEVLLRKRPDLLTEFLPDVLGFNTDRSGDVKKAMIGFMEEACKVNEVVMVDIMGALNFLVRDETVAVQKRVIQAAITIYRCMIVWMCKQPSDVSVEDLEKAWTGFEGVKLEIAKLIDSDNDGVRTTAAKFLECVILLQSNADPNEPKSKTDFSLDDVPVQLKMTSKRTLQEEADNIFSLLVKFTGSSHISSANLFVCVGVLTNIARSRPEYMYQVVGTLDKLHGKLPPTLGTTQVNSVRKKLRTEFGTLIRHPAAREFSDILSARLLDLGCTQNEIVKMIPKIDDRRKYSKRSINTEANIFAPKRPRLDPSSNGNSNSSEVDANKKIDMAIEANRTFISDNLNIASAVKLVMKGLYSVPDVLPQDFIEDYADSMCLGSAGDRNIVLKYLAEQMLESGIGPGSKIIGATSLKTRRERERSARMKQRKATVAVAAVTSKPLDSPKPVPGSTGDVTSPVVELMDVSEKETSALDKTESEKNLASAKASLAKIKTLKLVEITRPLAKGSKEKLLLDTVKRLLRASPAAPQVGRQLMITNGNSAIAVPPVQSKIVTTLASTFSDVVRDSIQEHLIKDLRSHIDIALGWLYEEYSIMQGFSRIPELRRTTRIEHSYNNLLTAFVKATINDSATLSRILLESPIVTESSLDQLGAICRQESSCHSTFLLLHDLAIRRPTRQLLFLQLILTHTTHFDAAVREQAIMFMMKLYDTSAELKTAINAFVVKTVDYLAESQPPVENLFGEGQGRVVKSETWNDELAKACLDAFIAVLPFNEPLLHFLARVYTLTEADVKRVILRLQEAPIRIMGMNSMEILKLVQECPKGAETLVTRMIHVLTEKAPPTPVLVQSVRDLYNTRVSDVRFLIPVLNGLSKEEILEALPKLIKLSANVMKEVLNRLLGSHGESAVSATEFLVALHLVDVNLADIKTKIKVITMCLNEKTIFTQEVIAVVLQQLMEQNPLPTLLMRTVIQALGFYPRLSGFVMNILQRLILKQVWKQKVVWEGFIRCCQRTKPQCFGVLMQLPAPQLTEALTMCPELRDPLRDNLATYTEAQRAHIPMSIQDVISGFIIPKQEPIMLGQMEMPKLMEPLPPGME